MSSTVASTGPASWAIWNCSVFSPTASVSCSRSTRAGSIAVTDGFAIVHDVCSRNAVIATWYSFAFPPIARIARAALTTSETAWVAMAMSRRSNRSEIMPPWTEKSSIGAHDAKFSRPTASAEPVRS